MAEKKLSREIDETVQDLLEVREELLKRLSPARPWMKTAAIVLLGFIGARIALRLTGWVFSLLWGNKLLIAAIILLALSWKHGKMQP
jgi:hypothetical protein